MPQLSPPLGRFQVPPFFELPWQDFQFMCREVLSREPGIGPCYEYGKNGQAQFGADLLGEYGDSGEQDVAQCKCWREATAANIRDAAEEFLKHRKQWIKPKTRRFILLIACDVSDQKLQAAIREAKQRLNKSGMRLFVWGGRQIEDRLRLHREVAERYCGEVWADHICGKSVAATASAALVAGVTAVVAQNGELALELSAAKSRDLDRLTALSKQHRFSEALSGIRELRAARSWPQLEASLRARIVRFEATTVINLTGDLATAEKLIAEARTIDPAGDYQVAEAYHAYRSGNRDQALKILAAPKSLNAFNLRLGLTLEAGDPAAVMAAGASMSTGWQPDADTHRYLALAQLLSGQVAEAATAIDRAMNTFHCEPTTTLCAQLS